MSKGIVFDIDGVLLKGGDLIEGAIDALKKVKKEKIPHVFVTNGGGWTEEEKAISLSKKLECDISPKQIIACHTPYQNLVPIYQEEYVLVIGKKECINIAKSYGFKKVVSCESLHYSLPRIMPIRSPEVSLEERQIKKFRENDPADENIGLFTEEETLDLIHNKIKAVFVFHDPIDWLLDKQILLDTLVSSQTDSNGHVTFTQRIPMYACNADIIYATNHSIPRLTQGAFVESFRALASIRYTNLKLEITYYGKPYKTQYDFAINVLEKQVQEMNSNLKLNKFYGIGDNPKSDIRGANNAGDKWTSMLVCTGLYTPINKTEENLYGNDPEDPADWVGPSVSEAIDYIIYDK